MRNNSNKNTITLWQIKIRYVELIKEINFRGRTLIIENIIMYVLGLKLKLNVI